jgi:pimeloyl-ACP methyl ester carboxylesterase
MMNALFLAAVGLLTLVVFGYTLISFVVAHMMTRAKRLDPNSNPLWARYKEQHTQFHPRAGQLKLSGWFLEGALKKRAILMVHGKDCCRGQELNTDTFALAHRFLESGFSVFMIDLRGHGQSQSARMTFGVNEANDVLGAIDWLLQQGFERQHIGLFGASMGGASAIRALSADWLTRKNSIGALVTDSTYADFNAMMTLKFRRLSGLPNMFLPGAVMAGVLLTGVRLSTIRPAQDASVLLGLPMLVIHSKGDPFVPVEHATSIASKSGATLWITDGAHHLASYLTDPIAYQSKVVDFFEKHLQMNEVKLKQLLAA